MRSKTPRFAAVLMPTGHHMVAYRPSSKDLEVERYREVTAMPTTIERAAERLASMMEAEGGRGAKLSIAIAGFGSCHYLLSIPPAPEAVIKPILQREMRRFFPDLFADEDSPPVIEAVPAGEQIPTGDKPTRDLLVGAVPRRVVDVLERTLKGHGIVLEHLTVLPAALLRVYQSYVGDPGTTALAIALPDHSVAGFFHDDVLRLFTESPTALRDGPTPPPQLVADQVSRGGLYLRQQFRGARLSQVSLVAERDDVPEIEALLQDEDGKVTPIGGSGAPGAMLALGVALDRSDPEALNLLPPDLRLPTDTEVLNRRLIIATALLIILTSVLFAAAGIRNEAQAAGTFRQAREILAPRQEAYTRIAPVVNERQAHTVRAEILRQLVAERERLPQLLWPLREFSPDVTVNQFAIGRSDAGWQGSLQGTAVTYSAAEAAAIVDALYRTIAAELPEGSVTLNQLNYGDQAEDEQLSGTVAVSFQLSFIVPLEEWVPE